MTELRLYREDGKERLQQRTSHKSHDSGLPRTMCTDWTDVPVVEAPKVPRVVDFTCKWMVSALDGKSILPDKGYLELEPLLQGKRWRVVCTEIL